MKSGKPGDRKHARGNPPSKIMQSAKNEWDFQIGKAVDIGTGKTSLPIRPEKVALGKKLAADPDYPSKPSMRQLARILIDKL